MVLKRWSIYSKNTAVFCHHRPRQFLSQGLMTGSSWHGSVTRKNTGPRKYKIMSLSKSKVTHCRTPQFDYSSSSTLSAAQLKTTFRCYSAFWCNVLGPTPSASQSCLDPSPQTKSCILSRRKETPRSFHLSPATRIHAQV